MRALKIRTRQGMVALTGEEAGALRDRLAQVGSAQAAGGTLSVSANASTSITFTDVEKAAVLEVLGGLAGASERRRGAGSAKGRARKRPRPRIAARSPCVPKMSGARTLAHARFFARTDVFFALMPT